MRFLIVADRELRSAARRRATYHTRWLTAAAFYGLLLYLLWAYGGFLNARVAPEIFQVYSVLAFLYCLMLATSKTADTIGAERREGTLGLLFLTNLNSAGIIAGKLCSTALASVYGLLAIFPMLALPLLMGGITFGHFAQTLLSLLNGILFGLSVGFLVSVLCRKQFVAIALALGVTFGLSGGGLLAGAVLDSFGPTRGWAIEVAIFSPLYALVAADGSTVFGANRFWSSLGVIAAISLGCLGLATWLLAISWRDRPGKVRSTRRPFLRRLLDPFPPRARVAFRRRLLDINPVCWLAGRQTISAPVFMALSIVITALAAWVVAPMFGRTVGGSAAAAVLGHLIAWLFAGLVTHALVLYYASMVASQRLAEDKETGALELILSTPTDERGISRGLWLAFGRRMFFPALLAVLVHCYFVYVCLVMVSLDPPGRVPSGAGLADIFWSVVLDKSVGGVSVEWEVGFMIRTALIILLLLSLCWATLGWVGRWLGLRMKHPGFAPVVSLALLVVPPVLLFSFCVYLAAEFHLDRLPDRQFLPVIRWLAFAIGAVHCLLLSLWARARLREQLRPIAMSRYQPLPPWRWRWPRWHRVRLVGGAAAAVALVLALAIMGYYGYQNWRSQRDWRHFLSAVKQRGETLELAPILPPAAPEQSNLARSPVFLSLLAKTNGAISAVIDRMEPFELASNVYQSEPVFMNWHRQSNAPLRVFLTLSRKPVATNRTEEAAALLEMLQPVSGTFRELAVAAEKSAAFQVSTNRDVNAIFQPPREQCLLLERIHLLYQVRACALLAAGRDGDEGMPAASQAAEDVLTGLRLARLARQIPDLQSALRVRGLLTRSLQPLHEGLGRHAWTGAQLAAMQKELEGFNVLTDYTNVLHRTVRAHIEVWRVIPASGRPAAERMAAQGGYFDTQVYQIQPRMWWYDHCLRLYNAGQTTLRQVDVDGGRIVQGSNWSELRGLPLSEHGWSLFQNSLWYSASPSSVAFGQTSLSQSIIACALERSRLGKGVYPETLEELVPSLLTEIPRDAITGRPMIYQRVSEGAYILRGVGPNGTDERKAKASDDWLWSCGWR